MSYILGFSSGAGFVCALFSAFYIGPTETKLRMLREDISAMTETAVRIGVAQYDGKTGQFTWKQQ